MPPSLLLCVRPLPDVAGKVSEVPRPGDSAARFPHDPLEASRIVIGRGWPWAEAT